MPTPTRPYAAIPADAGKVLRPVLPSLADEIIVYPGHGPATTVGHEKRTNPFLTGAARLIRR